MRKIFVFATSVFFLVSSACKMQVKKQSKLQLLIDSLLICDLPFVVGNSSRHSMPYNGQIPLNCHTPQTCVTKSLLLGKRSLNCYSSSVQSRILIIERRRETLPRTRTKNYRGSFRLK